jgi:hypothetical protein
MSPNLGGEIQATVLQVLDHVIAWLEVQLQCRRLETQVSKQQQQRQPPYHPSTTTTTTKKEAQDESSLR